MKSCSLSLFRVAACAAALAAVPVLSGCSGVVKNLNSAQISVPNVPVQNPFALNGKTAQVTLSGTPLATPAARPRDTVTSTTHGNTTIFSFDNTTTTISLADFKSASLSVTCAPTVTLTAPAGATLPTQFTLTQLSLSGEVDDLVDAASTSAPFNDSVTLNPLSISGPVTFTQQADGTYQATSGSIQLSQNNVVSDADLTKLINIVTAENPHNQAQVTLAAYSANLPAGTVMTVTFDQSTLTVKSGS